MSNPEFLPRPRVWQTNPGSCPLLEKLTLDGFQAQAQIDSVLPPSAYEMEITPDALTLRCADATAVTYAWQHFLQWRAAAPTAVPCGILKDAPTFLRRGFMLDISRCKVPTRVSLTEWVRKLSAFRYNELQLYTEHTFAYRGHEAVWAEASPLDAEDIRWLQSLCRDHGIELVPNQNCFGHFERWITHPAYRKFAESPDGFVTPWGDRRKVGSVLKPDDRSFELVSGLLDQLLPLFDSPLVNIGCDETFELGQGASKTRCEQEGGGKVYAEFVNRIMHYAQEKHGKRCQFWGDILVKTPAELKRLPADAMALEWGYEADHPFEAESHAFAASGLDFVLCPGTSSWRSFAGRTENMRLNIQRAAQCAKQQQVLGLLLTDWGDSGHLQQNPVSYPALAWCGLNAWNPDTADWADLPATCDQGAFEGASGDTACWLAAGKISDLLGKHPTNCNALFQLFENPQHWAPEYTVATLQHCLDAVEALPGPRTYVTEWQQTLRNLRFTLKNALAQNGEAVGDLSALRQEAREGHHACWLKRNREGGLAESLSMYTEASK